MKNYLKAFIARPTFAKEITAALVLKFIAMFLLWGLFFSHPVEDKISHLDVVKHLVE